MSDNIKECLTAERFGQQYPGKYLVISRLTDPLLQRGRARLIWRANTANAIEQLGLDPMLMSSPIGLPRGIEANQLINQSELNQFYGTNFTRLTSVSFVNRNSADPRTLRRNCAEMLFGGLIHFVGFVHNRDPFILSGLNERNIPYAYEDHNEDFHVDARPKIAHALNNRNCKLVIAITESVKTSLVLYGVAIEKIVVMDSGVSRKVFLPHDSKVTACRKFHLGNRFSSIAVYTGGLQEERGIAHILTAAAKMPTVKFVLAGGNDRDIHHWKESAEKLNLRNVHLAGYLNAEDTWILQKASNALLMTRISSERESITSPLKYFEYLAVGRPLVHYLSKDIFQKNSNIHAYRYDNDIPETLISAIERAIVWPWDLKSNSEHKDLANNYTWEKRCGRILKAVLEH